MAPQFTFTKGLFVRALRLCIAPRSDLLSAARFAADQYVRIRRAADST